MTPTHAAGQICPWNGGSLWIGRAAAVNDVHAHHAVQVALALQGRFRFRSPADDVWLDCTGAVITSNKPHAFDGRGAELLAHIFVEPESAPGRVLLQRFPAEHGICLMTRPLQEAAATRLLASYQASHRPEDLVAAAREVIRFLTDGVDVPEPADPRILRAAEYLRANLEGAVSLAGVAAVVNLSPSRFRHLFVHQMGLSFRQYVLWLRLNRALEAFAAGESLTAAAYRAGFADSAHLSRTFRRMYGMAAGGLRLD